MRNALAAVVLTALAVGLSFVPSKRLIRTDEPPSYCGAVQTIQTCFYPEHRRVAPTVQEDLWALFEVTQARGYGALIPVDGVYEVSPTHAPKGVRQGAAFVTPEMLAGERPDVLILVQGLVEPVYCPQLASDMPPSETYGEDLRALMATWAGLVDPSAPERIGHFGPALEPKQAAELLAALRSCEYKEF